MAAEPIPHWHVLSHSMEVACICCCATVWDYILGVKLLVKHSSPKMVSIWPIFKLVHAWSFDQHTHYDRYTRTGSSCMVVLRHACAPGRRLRCWAATPPATGGHCISPATPQRRGLACPVRKSRESKQDWRETLLWTSGENRYLIL